MNLTLLNMQSFQIAEWCHNNNNNNNVCEGFNTTTESSKSSWSFI